MDYKNKMKTLGFLTAIFVSLSVGAGPEISAQDYVPTPVTVSKEKVKVDGKLYYSHIVLERQTLYSICKAYGVTAAEVYEANPTLIDTGLKKNAIILIPVSGQVTDRNTTVKEGKDTTDTTKGKPAKQKKKKKEKEGDFIVHTVRWYEDLDVISEKYGVPVEAIMQANGLSGRKLSNRQKLKIPAVATPLPEEVGNAEETAPADTTETAADTLNRHALFPGIPAGKKKVDAILMLPFNAGAERPSEGNMDFYCGALLAVKDLGDSGISVDLSVYDVADGNLHITVERLQKSDVVIGPVSSGDLGRLLGVAPEGTVIVSPLDHRAESLVETHENLIQAPSSTKAQYKDLADWINEDRSPADPVIVIHEKGYNILGDDTAMETILGESGIPYKTFSYSILEGREITKSLEGMMSADACNRVLVMSESEAFVNDVVRNLNLMIHNKYDIVLYGPSKIRSFETIEVDNLHNVRLHTSVSYYIDYDSPEVRRFVMQYRALYNTEPTPYAFQGYDIVHFFLKSCSDYGRGMIDRIGEKRVSLLQADFKFERVSEGGGYINNAVRRVVYGPDYSVTLE